MLDRLKKLVAGRRWLWIVGVVVVIGGALFAYTRISASNRRAAFAARNETAKVQSGDISGTVTASGHLQAHQSVSLSMQTSGIVKEIDVVVGDKVKVGQTLLKLDDTDAQRSVKSAQNALDEAKLSAKSAQITYDSDAGYKPSDSSLASAIANANNAAAAVQAAQANYDHVAFKPNISSTSQSLALAQATNNYNAAKASLDAVLTNRPELATPKINLDLANLKVDDAQIALDAAQATLDRATLAAPFDGTITAVNTQIGASASSTVINMISADNLEGQLLIGETDMAALSIGEPVTFTLSTWPDTTLKGKVIGIDPTPTVGTNADVINYGVRISVDNTDLPILVGMTINATITTYNLKGVLLVPNGAVILDTDGKYYVYLVSNGQSQKTEVKIGVHNSDFTQIVSGLSEGDEIQVSGLTAPVRNGNPGGFGGPRFGGPGG